MRLGRGASLEEVVPRRWAFEGHSLSLESPCSLFLFLGHRERTQCPAHSCCLGTPSILPQTSSNTASFPHPRLNCVCHRHRKPDHDRLSAAIENPWDNHFTSWEGISWLIIQRFSVSSLALCPNQIIFIYLIFFSWWRFRTIEACLYVERKTIPF